MKKFSVIIPTHNGAGRIGDAVYSVVSQRFDDWELIIVLDSCSDDTEKSVKDTLVNNGFIKKLNKIKFIKTNVHRDGLARNEGLDHAEGEWILFLDDDDYFLHEFCFEKLAEKTENTDADIIDFSFIWKGKGYKSQSPKEQFVMVWSRAWRRDFFTNKRFNDTPYGSDRDFYEQYIKNTKTAVTIAFWDFPMYYYNHMRPGSLSETQYHKSTIDFIILHNDEPWEIGKPFFDMMQMQQCADLHKINVVIVQDGNGTPLEWDALLKKYTYNIRVVDDIEETGPAAGFNAGIHHATGEWVMFCNFDDMLTDVCSLSMMLETLPTSEYDIIWCKTVREQKWYTGVTYLNKIDCANFAITDGKLYRRQVLTDNNVLFNPAVKYYYGRLFNATLIGIIDQSRIAMLTTEIYPYYKRWRDGSYRHTMDAYEYMINVDAIKADCELVRELNRRNLPKQTGCAYVKLLLRDYYTIYDPSVQKKNPTAHDLEMLDIVNQYTGHTVLPQEEIDAIRDEVETEAMNLIQSIYNEHGREFYIMNDDLPFTEWHNQLLEVAGRFSFKKPTAPVIELFAEDRKVAEEVTASEPEYNIKYCKYTGPKVVVYCGTSNVYVDMYTSLKSLLSNTPVDDVYLIIEDDAFPYELPDNVHAINIKSQPFQPFFSLLDPNGPNYNSAWTYMCLVRALYPDIFSAYEKILSLDVDVIINTDISDLWDMDISDYLLAGVEEPQRRTSPDSPPYINFGVVMMNIKRLIGMGIESTIISDINRNRLDCPEQTAYNKACSDGILTIPPSYNYTVYSHITGDADEQKIIHFAGQKFWKHYSSVKKYADTSIRFCKYAKYHGKRNKT